MKLYLLPAAFAEVEAALADEGEVSPELAARLDGLDLELKAKLEGCCRVLKRFEAEAEAYQAEAHRLTRHAITAAGRARWLKAYMDDALAKLGIDRIETELFRLRRQLNPPSVVLSVGMGALDLPDEYQRMTIEPDRAKLLEAHKAGRELPPGVTVTQTRSLRIT